MLFSQGDKNENKTKEKKQSTLGFLFNPNFGSDIRPTKQALGMFARLIAMVFVSFRLFPKEHPAFRDDTISLPLRDVITTAWSQLSFTRQGLPQVVAFAAVVGALVFSALFVVTLLASLLIGSAHAQTTSGMFSPVDPSCDLANKWLDYLFMGKGIGGAGCSLDGNDILIAPSGEGMQKALAAILNFFSKGVLVCAGFILLYHLLIIIGDTAYSGKPFGRANALWAPIRLVVAIGLLVPVSTTGLNLGQHMAVQVARWGSNLASKTWQLSLDTIIANAGDGKLDTRVPVPKEFVEVVNGIILSKACEIASNNVMSSAYSLDPAMMAAYKVSVVSSEEACPGVSNSIEVDEYGANQIVEAPQCKQHVFSSPNGKMNCGKIVIPSPAIANTNASSAIISGFHAAHVSAVEKMLASKNVETSAKEVMLYMESVYEREPPTETQLVTRKIKAFEARNLAASEYRALLNEGLNKSKSLAPDVGGLSELGKHGWVTAGAWYNTIARTQAAVFRGAEAPMPQVISPIDGEGIVSVGAIDEARDFFAGLTSMVDKSEAGNVESATELVSKSLTQFRFDVLSKPFYEGGNGTLAALAGGNTMLVSSDSQEANMLLSGFFSLVDFLGVYFNIWKEGDGISITFGNTSHPLAEMSAFGYRNTLMGLNLLSYGAVGSLAGGLASAVGALVPWVGAAGSIASGLATIILFVGSIFLAAGITLAFVLPLIPFLKFFYNVLTWLLIVFETVVAAPLFALAHLSPYGEGMPGQAAKGYMLLFSLLLRPALLVIGLVVGFLFFFVAINFMNAVFNVAAHGTGATGGALSVLAKIVFTVLYCISAYVCANKCFQTISYFPERVMEWFGGPALMGKPMGDAGNTTGAMKLAAGYLGMQAVEKLTPTLSNMGTGLLKPTLDSQKKAKDDAKADKEKGKDFANRVSAAAAENKYLGIDPYNKDAEVHGSFLPPDHPVMTHGQTSGGSTGSGGAAPDNSGGGPSLSQQRAQAGRRFGLPKRGGSGSSNLDPTTGKQVEDIARKTAQETAEDTVHKKTGDGSPSPDDKKA